MQIKNPTIQKFISTILIIGFLLPAGTLFLTPKKADAQFHDVITGIWTGLTSVFTGASKIEQHTQTAVTVKNVAKEITKQIVGTIVRRALQALTKSTVNYINTGNWGNPLFIENPKSFFKDIAKTELKTFIDQTGYNTLRFPFGKDYALRTINAFKAKSYSNMEYTLSRATQDPVYLRNVQNNFSTGGWDGFLINTQFPQNNPIGYDMLATQKLAEQLAGTYTNAATEVQKKVQQAGGFLSPQNCPSNPDYPATANPYKKPSFDAAAFDKAHPWKEYPQDEIDKKGEEWLQQQRDQEQKDYDEALAKAQTDFNKKYACPGGFKDTTPGTIIGGLALNATSTKFRQSELGQALNVSISAVFDALTNKLLDKGLSALTSKINPKPESDDWSYYGKSLGSAVTGGDNYSWDSGPDEEISLDEFKKQLRGKTIVLDKITGAVLKEEIGQTGRGEYIPGDIANTAMEIKLMDNESALEPGITQEIAQIWPKLVELDRCIPGPNLGWESRLIDERDRNSQKLQEKSSDSDPEKAARAGQVYKELQFAVGAFKDWINIQMMTSLPDAITYIDQVKSIDGLYQQNKELTDKKRARAQALARIKAIDLSLNNFTTQPEPGSGKEKALILIRKQYNATKDDISNSAKIEDTRNELSIAKDKLSTVRRMVVECTKARTERGWTNPGGELSIFRPDAATPAPTPSPTPTPAPTPKSGNDVNPPPSIDINQVVWGDADVSGWSATANLGSVDIGTDSIKLNYDKANTWTPKDALGDPTAMTVGNAWIFVHKDGRWMASTFDYLRPGQTEKDTSNIRCGGGEGTLHGLGDFAPVQGETYGFMVSGLARNGAKETNEHERSNIVMQTWTDPTSNSECGGEGTPGGEEANSGPSGSELALFCGWPIAGGYDHASFLHKNDKTGGGFFSKLAKVTGFMHGGIIGGIVGGKVVNSLSKIRSATVPYPEIPYVNAQDVFNWPGFLGLWRRHVNIELNCPIIFRTTFVDYKQDLPGTTILVDDPLYGSTSPGDDGGQCTEPADSEKHADPGIGAAVSQAKAALASTGMIWREPTEGEPGFEALNRIYECNRFQITKRAAKILEGQGSEAGLWTKTAGNNCEGYAVDIIAFPDGYLYDVLSGGDPQPTWGAATCEPITPEKYKPATQVP